MNQQQPISLCLGPECDLISKLITDANGTLQHKNHQSQRSLKDINNDLGKEENMKILMNFLDRKDSDLSQQWIDEAREQIMKSFVTQLDKCLGQIKSLLSMSSNEIQRIRGIFNSLLTNDLDVLDKIGGDFSIIMNIKSLNNLAQNQQKRVLQAKLDIDKLRMITSKLFEEQIVQQQLQQSIYQNESKITGFNQLNINGQHEHILIFGSNDKYKGGFLCDYCRKNYPNVEKRWICQPCSFDCCIYCFKGSEDENFYNNTHRKKQQILHNHPLQFDIHSSSKIQYLFGWSCNKCKGGKYPRLDKRWMCKLCDFDCCQKCYDQV